MKYLFRLMLTVLLFHACQQKQPSKASTDKKQRTNTQKDTLLLPEKPHALDTSFVINHYILYKNDDDASNQLQIAFDAKGIAYWVQYKGQSATIPLTYTGEIYQEGGAHPTIIHTYDEIYEGKPNGHYRLTHSGNWDYLQYTRGKDGKTFAHTLDHNATPYHKTPYF